MRKKDKVKIKTIILIALLLLLLIGVYVYFVIPILFPEDYDVCNNIPYNSKYIQPEEVSLEVFNTYTSQEKVDYVRMIEQDVTDRTNVQRAITFNDNSYCQWVVDEILYTECYNYFLCKEIGGI